MDWVEQKLNGEGMIMKWKYLLYFCTLWWFLAVCPALMAASCPTLAENTLEMRFGCVRWEESDTSVSHECIPIVLKWNDNGYFVVKDVGNVIARDRSMIDPVYYRNGILSIPMVEYAGKVFKVDLLFDTVDMTFTLTGGAVVELGTSQALCFDGNPPWRAAPGSTVVTTVPSRYSGDIAVEITVPGTPRYAAGAGIVVEVSTFFTNADDFENGINAASGGLIHLSYLWPGKENASGVASGGTFDYGGPNSIRALKDVIRFAGGLIPDSNGHYLRDISAVNPLTDNLGLYTFSHPGIAAVNVLASYGRQMKVAYFVGRENPTVDTLSAVEIGHWDDSSGQAVYNPMYVYPDCYFADVIKIDYSSICWDPEYRESGSSFTGRPYFDLNGNGIRDSGDYVLGPKIPQMFGKRVYSRALTQALLKNGAIARYAWPEDLATPEEADYLWASRESVGRFDDIGTLLPDLKVMLVFADYDHVQPSVDKPHIHQAYKGFRQQAGLWTRLNPDKSYLEDLCETTTIGFHEHPANAEPDNWFNIGSWSYRDAGAARVIVPFAAVLEMSDRTMADNWDVDIPSVLYHYSMD